MAATSDSRRSNLQQLTTLEDIQKGLQNLCKEEARVNEELVVLLKQQPDMCCLNSMVPNLQMINNDAAQLSGMISFTSTLAENISSKVRQLDLAKSRVTVCMQRVEDVWDLKYCTDGVQTALQDEDYEKAAAHIHRFLSLDENVLRMSADASEGSTLDTSFKLLHEAQNKLQMIVHRQFDAAVHCGDVASVERFFKIFPLIGQHKEGLAKFSKYLCAQLSDIADKNLKTALSTYASDKRANVIFADTLTLLFEGIARVVEIHQPLVETYYGPGRMFTMMQYLQKECDRQSRKIIDHFRKQRNLELKLQQVQQSLFQRTLPSAEKIDPKELDPLLAEVTLLNARAELYTRFVRRRIMNDLDVATQNEEAKAASVDEVDKLITTCELSRQMQELIGNYIMMEEYFMHEMITKAVSLDITDESSLTSSMVDDAFFIVKKCVRRALSSSSIDGVCAMLNHACSILEQDFQEVFYARLRQGMPSGFDLSQAYNLVQSSLQFGKLQSSDDEAQKQKMTFLTTLNNAEVSGEYIQTLKKNLEDDIAKLYGHVNEQGSAKLQSCLSDLGAVSTRFTDMLEFGFSQFNTGVLKPRLRPWLDAFLSVDHNITEDDFTNYEANDPWVQTFIVNIDNFLVTFKSSLTSGNYDSLIRHLSNEITTRLEKNVMKTTFNRLGGLQFDKELRSLIGYLTSVTTWTIRDRFARLTQMATILNLERVSEMMDYWGPNSGPLTWRLTPAEVRQVLSLRLDFKNEDIKKLKL